MITTEQIKKIKESLVTISENNKQFKKTDIFTLFDNMIDISEKNTKSSEKINDELLWYKEAFRILMYSYNGCSSCIHSELKTGGYWSCKLNDDKCICGSLYQSTKDFFENEFRQELSQLPQGEDKYKLHSHQFNELDISTNTNEEDIGCISRLLKFIKEGIIVKE